MKERALLAALLALAACRTEGEVRAARGGDGEPAAARGVEVRAQAPAMASASAAPAVLLTAQERERALTFSPLPPPPPDTTNRWADDPAAAHLGRFLFFDERLSGDGTISCATCHDPAQGFADGRGLAVGKGELNRHAPALWNVAYQRWLFWDGRADTLWAQALAPLENPLEHGGSRLQYAHLVADDPELRAAYEAVFGPLPDLSEPRRFPREGRPVPPPDSDPLIAGRELEHDHHEAAGGGRRRPTHPHQAAWDRMRPADREAVSRVFANVGKALAAYQRRIVSRGSRFDTFVAGLRDGDPEKLAALDASEQRGLALFVGKARCHICHTGPTFSDLEFHDARVPPLRDDLPPDPGRREGLRLVQENPFNGMGAFSDDREGAARRKLGFLPTHSHGWGEFKTPGLREVAGTAPYMHQGQYATLEEVVHHYSTLEDAIQEPPMVEKILVPLELDAGEVADLVAFLRSLSGEGLPPELLAPPSSPLLRE